MRDSLLKLSRKVQQIGTPSDNEDCPDYEKWCSIMKPQLNRIVWGE